MNYLTYSNSELKELGGYWTAKEINQQPTSWSNALTILKNAKPQTDEFLAPLLAQQNLRIILTGAGTSAFVGASIAPALSANLNCRVEAIATTDLVSNPYEFFKPNTPTLVISFARSGNSPESVAALQYADKLVDNCYQLALTCNPDGALNKQCQGKNKLSVLMPEETNDKSFAMTSSFSSMLLSALYLFAGIENFDQKLESAITATNSLISTYSARLKETAKKEYSRVVFLGSGVFKGLAQESALKLLELTDGKACSSYDSPLGFRHGPKAIVNSDTLVFLFISNDPFTRQYDLDLLKELQNDSEAAQLIVVGAQKVADVLPEDFIQIQGMEDSDDALLLLPYIVSAQIYALEYSLSLGNTPDSPSSSGTINRVVQGVTIYDV